MAEEYIKLHKQVIESDIYRMPPLYLRVFERLLLEANHEDKTIRYKPKGKTDFIERIIKRGEQKTSIREIGEWVSWYENGSLKIPNKKTIKVILDWLISQKMIEIFNKGNALETHYNVLKYEVYQGCDTDESNALETVWNPPQKEKIINPQNSKQEVFDYWNSKKIVNHSSITNNLRIALGLAVKRYPLENIKTAIDHYATMYKDPNYEYCKYKWTLEKFLDDSKGVSFFMDDGQKWLSYQNQVRKTPTDKPKDFDPYEIKRSWE